MSGAGASVTVTGVGETQAGLAALAARIDDLADVMDEIGSALVANAQLRFEQERDPGGSPWAALQPATARRKAKAGKERILTFDAHLRASLTHRPGARQVEVGSNLIYAATHQFGRDAIKARPYLPIPELGADDQDAIAEIVRDALTRALGERL